MRKNKTNPCVIDSSGFSHWGTLKHFRFADWVNLSLGCENHNTSYYSRASWTDFVKCKNLNFWMEKLKLDSWCD